MIKNILVVLMLTISSTAIAQDWMSHLEIAQRMALVQDKLLLVVWEDAFYQKTPILIKDRQGNDILIEDSYNSRLVDSLLWSHFVPVVWSEDRYAETYESIKDRPYDYVQKFNDDSMKIMDVNGNILNKVSEGLYLTNLTDFIQKYALDMSFLKNEYINYKNEKTFYSTFYLASKYLDFTFFLREDLRPEMIDLALIYLNESKEMLESEPSENKTAMWERIELLEIETHLLTGKPKKVLRQLNRLDANQIDEANQKLLAFLYFSSYRMLNDAENMALWRPKMSLMDLKKIMALVNDTTN